MFWLLKLLVFALWCLLRCSHFILRFISVAILDNTFWPHIRTPEYSAHPLLSWYPSIIWYPLYETPYLASVVLQFLPMFDWGQLAELKISATLCPGQKLLALLFYIYRHRSLRPISLMVPYSPRANAIGGRSSDFPFRPRALVLVVVLSSDPSSLYSVQSCISHSSSKTERHAEQWTVTPTNKKA